MKIIDRTGKFAKFGDVKIGTAVRCDGAYYIKTDEVRAIDHDVKRNAVDLVEGEHTFLFDTSEVEVLNFPFTLER